MEHGLIAWKRNTSLWPVRPAGILPPVLRTGWQRSKTSLGAQTWKSVFLQRRLPKASPYQRLLRDSFRFLFVNQVGRGDILCRDTH